MKIEKILLSKPGRKIVSSIVAFPFLRKLGMDSLDRVINKKLSEVREEWVPPLKVIEDQRHILHNMAKVVDRWASNKHVTKSSLDNFLNSFGTIFSKSNDSVREEFAGKYGFSPPGFLTISPTKVCNLQCKGCYASSGADTNISLNFDVVNRIIEEKEKLWGATFTVISGGEPFMYKSQGKSILDLAQLHPSNFFLVYTNGTLIDKKIARKIAELGNITPAISVEGFEKETDERRGNGVHKRILQSFENLREAGVLFGLSVTATRNNAETILSPEFIDYYLNQNGAYYMWIFQYMPIGRSFSLKPMVSPKQRLEMLRRTRELLYKEELFVADFWNSATLSIGCISAGRSGGYIYIDWNGNVLPCVFNPYTTQNILKVYEEGGNLNDVLLSPLMKRIRNWQQEYLTDRKTGQCGNLLVPCPIRDHHSAMRKILDETNAQPADEPAKIALNDNLYYRGMCHYGEMVQNITRGIWEEEYIEEIENKKKNIA